MGNKTMRKIVTGGIPLIVVAYFILFVGISSTGDIVDNIENPDLKFIVIGDPHIEAKDNDTGAERLRSIVSFINDMDIDFVVILGDITDKGTRKQYILAKDILDRLNKPYYVVIGNHDLMTPGSEDRFKQLYGDSEKIENIRGNNTETVYQLLFIGTSGERNSSGNITNLTWSFDFNRADKNIPTIVFSHTPIRCPSSVYISCKLNEEKLIYGNSMETELKGLNLLGIYSGHIHRNSNDVINGVKYITINGLVYMGTGGILTQSSDEIGYSVVKDGKLYYGLIFYR